MRRLGGGGSLSITIEADRVDTEIAILLALGRKLEGNVTSTTTLSVLDRGTTSLACRCMLALGAVRHGEDEVNVGVESDRDVKMRDGELVVLSTRDLGSTATTLGKGTLNTFALFIPVVSITQSSERKSGLPESFPWSPRISCFSAGRSSCSRNHQS